MDKQFRIPSQKAKAVVRAHFSCHDWWMWIKWGNVHSAKVDNSLSKSTDFPYIKSICNPVSSTNSAGQILKYGETAVNTWKISSYDAVWCVYACVCDQQDVRQTEGELTAGAHPQMHTSKPRSVRVNISLSSSCWIVDTEVSWSQSSSVIELWSDHPDKLKTTYFFTHRCYISTHKLLI